MAYTKTTLYDKDLEAAFLIEAPGAESKAQIVDASALDGNSASGTEVLDLVGIKWNSAAAGTSIQLHFDATTDDNIITVYGSGELGFGRDNTMFKFNNPKSSGYNGDILATTSAACNFIILVRKREGYTGIDYTA